MLNKAMIIGNVGKEPEMQYTPNGKAVTNFSVAVNSKYGEKETTEWFSVTAWGKLGETCNSYLTKGQQVYVEGRLQTESWEADGVTKYRTKLIADKVLFLGKRQSGGDENEV